MDDQQGLLCESLCRTSPAWLVELIVLLLLAGRTLWVQWRNGQLRRDKDSLQATVQTLSMRPPPPVQIQLAPHTGLASLLSMAPADPTKTAQNATVAPADSPEPSDPDHLEPDHD